MLWARFPSDLPSSAQEFAIAKLPSWPGTAFRCEDVQGQKLVSFILSLFQNKKTFPRSPW